MRKKLVITIVFIGIFGVLYYLPSVSVQTGNDKVLLDTAVGAVDAGSFSYWELGRKGPLVVVLTSLSGDADLYVSENIRPGYEIDRNNFSSATCGDDVVFIPADFPRPLGIGIFGHWSHLQSDYSLQVFLDVEAANKENYLEIPTGYVVGAQMQIHVVFLLLAPRLPRRLVKVQNSTDYPLCEDASMVPRSSGPSIGL